MTVSVCRKITFDELCKSTHTQSISSFGLCIFLLNSVGTGLSVLQFTNLNMTRNLFVVGISIFLGLSVPQYFSEFASRAYHGPVHTHAHWVKFAVFHIVLDWLLYNNCALLFSTILKFTWVSFCSGWWVQFNNILNIFFGSPIIITFIVALVLDNTLLWHVSRKDRGLPWTRKFRSFGADARNLEFYSLPFGLHKIFPPNSWVVFFPAPFPSW
jgi:nucleobase transporter 1/2